MNFSCFPSDRTEVLRGLAEGERSFRMLHLENLDGVDLNLSECDL